MNAEDIRDLAQRIRNRGRLEIDMIINNTNLAGRTSPEMIMNGEKIVLKCAEDMGIGTVITAGMKNVLEKCTLQTPTMEISRYMIPEWMEE